MFPSNATPPTASTASGRARPASAPQAPSIRKKYHGVIVFTCGAFGDIVLIRADFPTLAGSATLNEHLQNFVNERAQEPGKIYRFEGSYMLFKNGSPSFAGNVTEVSA